MALNIQRHNLTPLVILEFGLIFLISALFYANNDLFLTQSVVGHPDDLPIIGKRTQ